MTKLKIYNILLIIYLCTYVILLILFNFELIYSLYLFAFIFGIGIISKGIIFKNASMLWLGICIILIFVGLILYLYYNVTLNIFSLCVIIPSFIVFLIYKFKLYMILFIFSLFGSLPMYIYEIYKDIKVVIILAVVFNVLAIFLVRSIMKVNGKV